MRKQMTVVNSYNLGSKLMEVDFTVHLMMSMLESWDTVIDGINTSDIHNYMGEEGDGEIAWSRNVQNILVNTWKRKKGQ